MIAVIITILILVEYTPTTMQKPINRSSNITSTCTTTPEPPSTTIERGKNCTKDQECGDPSSLIDNGSRCVRTTTSGTTEKCGKDAMWADCFCYTSTSDYGLHSVG